ncbi:MAG TPA: hypothetical protein PKZ99_12360, partial [Azospirillaceae bacterium]|nr:hypothetical protein [Azospirillaceae bacterium]
MSDDVSKQTEDDADRQAQGLRLLEALLFASAEPLPEALLAARLGEGINAAALLAELRRHYH